MGIISKSAASAHRARPFYEEHEISDELKSVLEEEAKHLVGARRRSTEDAFEEGERFDRIATLLPEGTLEKWAVECCGYTARHVRTKRAVHRNLQPYKEILVALAVGPTVLGKMSAATPEQVEQIIGFASMHDRLRVQDVTAIMSGSKQDREEKPEIDAYDVGGPAGLKAIIAIKVRDGMKSFLGHVEEIRTHVLEALPKHNIVKKDLAAKTHLTARLAHRELQSLIQFVTPHPNDKHDTTVTVLPEKSGWEKVSRLLYKMGSETSWPDKAELRTWLETEVVPLLNWAAPEKGEATRPEVKADVAKGVVASAKVVADTSAPAKTSASPKAKALSRPSLEENLAMLTDGFTAIMTGDLKVPASDDDAIPSVAEALAKPEKRFQRPAFIDKIKPTSPSTTAA
ncbi:hypothetical protein [Rhizobium cremeum]|uniref:hypothetical protein n=1 Tax=Rhizobium cremeum TaxID=2813827 RepID=UPI0039DF75DC